MCIESRLIAVIGMGPAGGILGAHLSAAGHQVLAVEAWPGHREALAGKGLVLDGKLQLETAPLSVLTSIPELAGHSLDLIVLALKIPEALQALQEVAALMTAAPVMLLQNGLEMEEPFLMTLGKDRIIRLVVNYAGRIEGPGRIHVTFFNRPNWLGGFSDAAHPKAADWADVLTRSGLETRAIHDIGQKIWEKTVLNAVLAPVTAVLGVTMGEALKKSDVLALSQRLLAECLEVAEACGYRVSPEFIHFSRHYLAQGDSHRPSMLMDLDRGRGTEIDWLNGKIVELARRHEIPVPVNEVITALVKSLEPADEEPRSR